MVTPFDEPVHPGITGGNRTTVREGRRDPWAPLVPRKDLRGSRTQGSESVSQPTADGVGSKGTPDAVRHCVQAILGIETIAAEARAHVGDARRRGRRRLVLVALAVLLQLAGGASAEEPIGWTPGEGAFLPGHLWVAADLTFAAEIPEDGPTVVEIDRVSLLARWEPTPRLAFFGEARLEEPFHIIEGEGSSTRDAELSIERLYAELLVTPTLTLRLGKVFTPFGLWNPIHRAPLTWTVEEPAIADGLFPTETTGLSLLHRTTWHE